MEMHDPAHPGEVIRKLCLKPLDLTVTAVADALGVTRKAFSDLLNGQVDLPSTPSLTRRRESPIVYK